MHSSLRNTMNSLSKNKLIVARVLDVIGNRCSVQLAGNGKKIFGISYIGGPLSSGDLVYVNYASGQPVAEARGERATISSSRYSAPAPPRPDRSQVDSGGDGGDTLLVWTFNDDLTAQVDGIISIFTTSGNYTSSTLQVFHNGLLARPIVDYAETTSNTFTMAVTPLVGDVLIVHYVNQ